MLERQSIAKSNQLDIGYISGNIDRSNMNLKATIGIKGPSSKLLANMVHTQTNKLDSQTQTKNAYYQTSIIRVITGSLLKG